MPSKTPEASPALIRSVLLTSLPAFVLAEMFFAFCYSLIINGIQVFYSLFASMTTAEVEANIEIFSPLNISMFVVALIAVSLVTCLEIATIIGITIYDWYRDDHIPMRTIMGFAWERIRAMATLRTFPLFLIVMLFPKEHIGPGGLLSLDIPPFITDELVKNPTYTVLLTIVAMILVYIAYRSIFLIHIVLLEQRSFWQSIRDSARLTREIGIIKMLGMFARTLLWSIIVTLPILVIIYGLSELVFASAKTLGDMSIVLATGLSWLADFLVVSLPGVLLLASLTVTYIRHADFSRGDFERIFHFVALRDEVVPRWQNLRLLWRKKWLLASVITLSFASPLFLSYLVTIDPALPTETTLVAHRGYLFSGATTLIENTIPAILNAHNEGADMVEIDVYENKDGTLVLSHDPNWKRVAGVDRAIADMTDADIHALELAGGARVPTLEEVFALAREQHIRLIVEPKLHGREQHLYDSIIALYEKYDMYETAWVHSLSLPVLLEIKKREPRIHIGYTIFGGVGNFGAIPVDFYSLQETVATPRVVNSIHSAGKKVYLWTVNTPDHIERYLRMGVDGFITDELALVRETRAGIILEEQNNPKLILRILGYEMQIPRLKLGQ